MIRVLTAAAIAAGLLLGGAHAAGAQALPTQNQTAARNPVIFVHGYGGSAADVASVKPALLAAGYTDGDIHSLDFPNGETNENTGRRLSGVVDQLLASSGAAKVDVIGFSMGGLSSRYYLKNLGGSDKVAHFASIAGPNHGTSQASLCWIITSDPACPQMAPGSAFLTALNSGDETPGNTLYATWISDCDGTIDPVGSTALAGAENHRTTACLKHNETPGAPEVTSGVIAFFAGSTPPPPPPATNLALNKPATSSTPCTSTETAAKAVNGSVSGGNSDKWCSGTRSKWLQVDLGASRSLTGFTLKHAQAGGEPASYNTKGFTIKVSTDGKAWTTLATVTNNTAATSTHPVTATSARYVRVDVTAPTQGTDTFARIYELEVAGS